MATLAQVPNNNTYNTNTDYDVNTFWINNSAQDSGYQFRPAKAFNDIDAQTVLNIITKADLTQAKTPNKKGKINFILSKHDSNNINRVFGYLNNVENDLTIESDAEVIADTLFGLEATLSKVTLSDITQPLTAKGAEEMLAML